MLPRSGQHSSQLGVHLCLDLRQEELPPVGQVLVLHPGVEPGGEGGQGVGRLGGRVASLSPAKLTNVKQGTHMKATIDSMLRLVISFLVVS